MFSGWDKKHWFIFAMFVLGFGWALWAVIAALPAGASAGAVIAALAPVALLSISHWVAFFNSPPSDPVQAFTQGEQAAGKAGARGFARARLLFAFAAVGFLVMGAQLVTGAPVIHPMTVQGQGCGFLNHEAPVLKQDAEIDIPCVLSAVLGGGDLAACGVTDMAQLGGVLGDLIAYYESQRTDAGLAGASPVPFRGIPAVLSDADLAKLKTFLSKIKDAGK